MNEALEANGHKVEAMAIRNSLTAWGFEHFRSFPWRLTADPYRILVAEVMLHRTQAKQVVKIYESFIKCYPSLKALAQATKDELRDFLYPLGLHWRIDLIKQMANQLIVNFGGQIPQDKEALLSLPGVGNYIASSVCCFSWNQPEPIIDTNTVRVVGRLFNLDIKESSRRNRLFRDLITGLLDYENPRAFNYALLDLAEQICTPRKPYHAKCPILDWCKYGLLSLGYNKC